MVGEDLISRVLMSEALSGISQYYFDMGKLTVHPNHVTLPYNKYECKNIEGIETIENLFRVVNISSFNEIR